MLLPQKGLLLQYINVIKFMKNYWAGGTEGGNQSDFIKNNYWDGIYFGHNTKHIKGKKTADSNFAKIKKGDGFLIKGKAEIGKTLNIYYIGEVLSVDRRNQKIILKKVSNKTPFRFPWPRKKEAGNWNITLLQITRQDLIKRLFNKDNEVLSPIEKKNGSKRNAIDLSTSKIGHVRKTVANEVFIKEEHKQIQKELKNYFDSKGVENTFCEQDYVDLKTDNKGIVTFYEIKPFKNPILCIRESIGQLLEYSIFAEIKPRYLVAIGKNPLSEKSKRLLKEIQKKIPKFSYQQFDMKKMKLIE